MNLFAKDESAKEHEERGSGLKDNIEVNAQEIWLQFRSDFRRFKISQRYGAA
jgi:hypothetical protein